MFDLDDSGSLDRDEFQIAAKALGFMCDKHEITSIFGEKSAVGYPSYLEYMSKRIRERNPENEMRRAFALLDSGNKGYVSEADLKTVHKTLGLDATGIATMISEFSSNGKIDFETFCLIQKQGSSTRIK